jgi:hypothetical protein
MPLSLHDPVVGLRRITDRISHMMPGRRKDLGRKASV